MAYCSNCGERNDNQSKFCKNCGEVLKTGYHPSKPIKSRIESTKEDEFIDKDEQFREEYGYYDEVEEETPGIIEWDVIVGAILILILLAGILVTILPQISTWIGVFMSLVYVLIFTRKKSNLIINFPLTLIIAAAIWALFSL